MLLHWENISKIMEEWRRAAAVGSGYSISMCLCSEDRWVSRMGQGELSRCWNALVTCNRMETKLKTFKNKRQWIISWNKKLWARSLSLRMMKSCLFPLPRVDFILRLETRGFKQFRARYPELTASREEKVIFPMTSLLKWGTFFQNHVPTCTDFSCPIRMPPLRYPFLN